jgi:hypothetical protein
VLPFFLRCVPVPIVPGRLVSVPRVVVFVVPFFRCVVVVLCAPISASLSLTSSFNHSMSTPNDDEFDAYEASLDALLDEYFAAQEGLPDGDVTGARMVLELFYPGGELINKWAAEKESTVAAETESTVAAKMKTKNTLGTTAAETETETESTLAPKTEAEIESTVAAKMKTKSNLGTTETEDNDEVQIVKIIHANTIPIDEDYDALETRHDALASEFEARLDGENGWSEQMKAMWAAKTKTETETEIESNVAAKTEKHSGN